LQRAEPAEPEPDDPEADTAMRAWLERAKWGHGPSGMTARPVPKRHWRSYGNDPLPLPADALDEPFAAFPSWFLRIECGNRLRRRSD
jgi:hypothetical protein